MFNPSLFLIPYCLPWQNKSKQHLQILTQLLCKMILNVFFFHMEWYYVNNCPLKWVFRRLFPWLLIRWLSPYILIWKYLWVIIAAAAAHALRTASLQLLCCTSWAQESCALPFFRNHNWKFVCSSLNLHLSSSHGRGAHFQWEACTLHKAASLAMPTNHFPPSSRLPVFFPVTPPCSQASD